MQASDLAALRARLRKGRDSLADAFVASPHPQHYLERHAKLVDSVLRALCDELLPTDTCLAAVGGYGREELFPASDVDVLLLIPREPDTGLQAQLEAWVQACWDTGLEIGHSIRTPEECANEAGKEIVFRPIRPAPVC
jgi:[protein-PII] uridylyltransferase